MERQVRTGTWQEVGFDISPPTIHLPTAVARVRNPFWNLDMGFRCPRLGCGVATGPFLERQRARSPVWIRGKREFSVFDLVCFLGDRGITCFGVEAIGQEIHLCLPHQAHDYSYNHIHIHFRIHRSVSTTGGKQTKL